MLDIFTSREIATGFWIVLLVVFCITNKEVRKSSFNFLQILFGKQLRRLLLLIILYNAAVTFAIARLFPLWKNIFLKDIIIWVITSGILIAFNSCSREAGSKYIINCIKKNIGVAVIVQFLLSTFTFNIITEIVMIPFVVIITAISTLAEKKEEYVAVHCMMKIIMTIFIIAFWWGTIKVGTREFAEIKSMDTLVSFLTPLVYLIMNVPLLFLIQIVAAYQTLFARMSIRDIDNIIIQRRHRLRVVKVCGLSLAKIRSFTYNYVPQMYKTMKESTFEAIIYEYSKEQNVSIMGHA